MDVLILNDGTILENSRAVVDLDNLFLYIGNGLDIVQLAGLLPGKVDPITYKYGDEEKVFAGFTRITGMNLGVNCVSVVLRP